MSLVCGGRGGAVGANRLTEALLIYRGEPGMKRRTGRHSSHCRALGRERGGGRKRHIFKGS